MVSIEEGERAIGGGGRMVVGILHLMAVRISLGDLPSSASLRMMGYLPSLVGSTTPGGTAEAAIVVVVVVIVVEWRSVGSGNGEKEAK